jgi:hypothetical protein
MDPNLIGGICSLLCAFLLALGMNIQRYALMPLEHGETHKTCCGQHIDKDRLWVIGLLIYSASNGPFIVGLSFAPLSLMSAIFATVLVFNAKVVAVHECRVLFSPMPNHIKLTGGVVVLPHRPSV